MITTPIYILHSNWNNGGDCITLHSSMEEVQKAIIGIVKEDGHIDLRDFLTVDGFINWDLLVGDLWENSHENVEVGVQMAYVDGRNDDEYKWVPMKLPENYAPSCECDNTHKQNNTVCRYCWAQGKRQWSDD